MDAPAVVESERLRFTRPRVDDAPLIFERYSSDPRVTKYLGWPRHQSVTDAELFIAFSDQEWARGGCGPYLVWLGSTSRLVGGTGLHRRAVTDAETGYAFASEAWGRGYATEALRTMISVSEALDIERIFATVHADHDASAHVLRKCGFTLDRRVRDQSFPNLAPPTALAYRYVRIR